MPTSDDNDDHMMRASIKILHCKKSENVRSELDLNMSDSQGTINQEKKNPSNNDVM